MLNLSSAELWPLQRSNQRGICVDFPLRKNLSNIWFYILSFCYVLQRSKAQERGTSQQFIHIHLPCPNIDFPQQDVRDKTFSLQLHLHHRCTWMTPASKPHVMHLGVERLLPTKKLPRESEAMYQKFSHCKALYM